MQRVVAVASQKGGVGKTTLSMNFASVAAETHKTLLVDVDEQESSTWWAERVGVEDLAFDLATDTNPDLLEGLGQLDYDLVIVDCPGHLTGEGVIPAVLRAADYVVLVTEPKPLAYPPLQRSIDSIVRPSGVPFRVLINNVDMSKGGERKQSDARDACKAMDVPVFKTFIRSYSVHEEASLNGQLATTYPRTTANINAIEDIRRFSTELFAEWAFPVDLTDAATTRDEVKI